LRRKQKAVFQFPFPPRRRNLLSRVTVRCLISTCQKSLSSVWKPDRGKHNRFLYKTNKDDWASLSLAVFKHPNSSCKERSSHELTLTPAVYNLFVAWTNNSHVLVCKQVTCRGVFHLENGVKSYTFRPEINFQLNGEPRKIRKDNSHCWCVFRGAGFVCFHTDNLLSLLATTTWERKSERKRQGWMQQRLRQKYVHRSHFPNWYVKMFRVLKVNSFVEDNNICWLLLLPSERKHISLCWETTE